jgi:predicted RNase H-like HicB family nuclease
MAAMTRMGFWHTGQPSGSTRQTRGIKWRAADWACEAGRFVTSCLLLLDSLWAQDHHWGMKYRVTLIEHEDGVSVSCPALRGCHSQGKTREEALANIQEAIREWLAAEADEAKLFKVSEAEVAI